MIIAIDFDGTIAQYDGWKGEDVFGEPFPGAVEALQTLAKQGHTIIIHTCRPPSMPFETYLHEHGIPYHSINTSPVDTRLQSIPHKLPADIYIDDKGLQFEGDWNETLERIRVFKSHSVPTHEWSEEEDKQREHNANEAEGLYKYVESKQGGSGVKKESD